MCRFYKAIMYRVSRDCSTTLTTEWRLAMQRFPVPYLAFAMMISLSSTAAAEDQESRGEAMLARHCARCHAIGRAGVSPHRGAPAFRTLAQRYPIEGLEEALGEGIISGHPHMPEFRFSGDDTGAIVAYLKSIQER